MREWEVEGGEKVSLETSGNRQKGVTCCYFDGVGLVLHGCIRYVPEWCFPLELTREYTTGK